MLLFAKEPAADQRRAGFSVSKENCGQPMFTFPPPSREQRSINSFGPTWFPNKSWSVGPCHHQGAPWVLGHPETSPPPARPVGGGRLSARPPAGVTGTGSGGVGGERGRPSPRAREPLPEEALSFPGAHCVAQAHLGSPQRRHSTQMPEEEGGLARHRGNSVHALKFAAQGSCSAGERVEGCLLAGDLSPAPGVAKLLIPPGA